MKTRKKQKKHPKKPITNGMCRICKERKAIGYYRSIRVCDFCFWRLKTKNKRRNKTFINNNFVKKK